MTCEKCGNCPIRQLCDEVDDCYDDYGNLDHELLAKIYTKGREDVIGEVIKSLKEVNYEYDENMNVDNNIGSAMLGEFAKGYNKGIRGEKI